MTAGRDKALAREGGEDIVVTILATTIMLTAISTITTILRCVSRFRYKKLGWSDGLAILGWACGVLYSFNLCWGTQFTLGRHAWNITQERRMRAANNPYPTYLYLTPLAHIFGMTFIRMSIILLYMHIANAGYRIFRIVCIATFVFVVATGVGIVLPSIITCLPIKANWDFNVRLAGATCLDTRAYYKATAIIFAVVDLIVLLLMVPMIIRSTLPFLAKMQALCVFLLGSVATIAAFFRIYLIFNAFHKTAGNIGFYTGQSMLGGAIEFQLAIICASIPAIKKLLHGKLGFLSITSGISEEEKTLNSPDSAAAYEDGVRRMLAAPRSREALGLPV